MRVNFPEYGSVGGRRENFAWKGWHERNGKTVAIYGEIGNYEHFPKTKIWIISFNYNLTAFGALKFETNNTIFLFFAYINQFREIASCWHFRRPADVALVFFFSSSESIFYAGNKVCARWDQKKYQKLQNMLKKSFWNTFFLAKTEQKIKIDQNVKRGRY